MNEIDHVTEIYRAMSGDGTQRDDYVVQSWRRCIETYGMDPARRDPAHVVTDAELRMHREQSERLIATARSGLQSLFRQVAGQNYVLLLADAKGVTVDFFGDERFADELRQAGLYMGSHWVEDLAGTSGVGACLVTGEAMTIHQGDHFGLNHTPLSCTAAPIYDTQGQLAAVLDVSLLRSPAPKSSQNLAFSLVTASARRVEMANLMSMTRRDWVLRFSTSPEFLEVDPEAAVALDGSGRIIGMTHGAARFLSQRGSGGLIGKRLDEVFEMSVDDLPDLMRGRPTEDRLIHLKDGGSLFGHAIAPHAPRVAGPTRERLLPGGLSSFAGPDPTLTAMLKQAARLADTGLPLLISGETGTGKERLARAIHVCLPETRAFHSWTCAGLRPADIAAGSDLAAGTLFLRGIEDLDAAGQAALLALVQARPDLRPLSSTRRDPGRAVRDGSFRADLFYRLSGAVLSVPPLRLRQDFDWLLEQLLRRFPGSGLQMSPAARMDLKSRDWPGNIRELESVLTVAARIADGAVIDTPDLPRPSLGAASEQEPEEELAALLDACAWNMSLAARRLGVNRSTVLRRVRKAGLTPPA
jgi:transcriptional regulator of acetoin/glycerol metabolism